MPVTKRKKRAAAPTRVSDPRLKTYLDATKNESVLLGAVDKYLQLLPNDRDTTVIHPSEMASKDWCHRATWHRLEGRTPKSEVRPNLRSMLIFAEGHTIHEKWQGWVRSMGILWGKWYCQVCHQERLDWSDSLGGVCNGYGGSPGPHLWKYNEVPLREDALRIAGHADGVVNPTYNDPMVLEVKSVGPGTLREMDLIESYEDDGVSSARFAKISRPARSHFLQTAIYLRLVAQYEEELGKIERAVVIYEHKSDQQVREFVLTRNDRWTDPLFDAAADIVWAIDRGREVACNHGGCARCAAYEVEN